VGVGIVLSGLVVLVAGVAGGEVLEPLADVVDESGLVVVDVDGGGDVHGRDEAEAVVDTGFADDGFNLGRDVDHLVAGFGFVGEVLGVDLHVFHPRGGTPPLWLQNIENTCECRQNIQNK